MILKIGETEINIYEGPPVYWQPGITLEKVEEWTIKAALRFFGGNKTAASKALGISARTIDNKLNTYNDALLATLPAASVVDGSNADNGKTQSAEIRKSGERTPAHGKVQAKTS